MRMGGSWIARMRPARSRFFFCSQACSSRWAMRMCSRDCIVSPAMPVRPSRALAVASAFSVRASARQVALRSGETAEDGQRQARLAARRVDAPGRRLLDAANAFRLLKRLLQPLPPPRRQLLGVCAARQVLLLGVLLVDPVLDGGRVEVGELQQQVRQVALGVDEDAGDVIDDRLFENADGQAGLARAGHADDDAVRRQVAGIVHDELVRPHRPRGQVVFAAEIEAGRLLDVEGSGSGRRRGGGRNVVGHGLGLHARLSACRIMRSAGGVAKVDDGTARRGGLASRGALRV